MFSRRDSLTLFYLFEFEQNVRNKAMLYIQNIQPGDKTKGDFHFSPLKIYGMKKIVKQVAGIDVAQNELVICLGRMYDDWTPELYASKTFANTPKGFDSFVRWVNKLSDPTVPVRYAMEATGVYHESLAYYLDEQDLEVSIILPNKISNYARTLNAKTVTDKTASEAITLFGLERKLDTWSRPKGIFKKLKQLTRERGQLVDERTVLKNQLHAEQAGAEPCKKRIERIKKRIALLNKQEEEIRGELKELIKSDAEIQQLIALICTLPGVSILTAATVLGETNGFDLIRNKRQLTSYAGLDVREKQSGTSVKGKPRISKKGNRHLRKAMHMPALAAIRHDERFKAVFARLVARHGIKMKAAVAVQRKLLELIYILFKTRKPYEKDYFRRQNQQHEITEAIVNN
jgi:transposase